MDKGKENSNWPRVSWSRVCASDSVLPREFHYGSEESANDSLGSLLSIGTDNVFTPTEQRDDVFQYPSLESSALMSCDLLTTNSSTGCSEMSCEEFRGGLNENKEVISPTDFKIDLNADALESENTASKAANIISPKGKPNGQSLPKKQKPKLKPEPFEDNGSTK